MTNGQEDVIDLVSDDDSIQSPDAYGCGSNYVIKDGRRFLDEFITYFNESKRARLSETVPSDENENHLPEFQRDPAHKIISEITSWSYMDLMNRKFKEPPVKHNHVCTIQLQYKDWEHYDRVLSYFVRLETWLFIQKLLSVYEKIEIKIFDVNYETRGQTKRIVFHCEISKDSPNQKIEKGDIVLVKKNNFCFLAYVVVRQRSEKCKSFTMEATKTFLNELISKDDHIEIITRINIMRYINFYKAIHLIKQSSFLTQILDPLTFKGNHITLPLDKYREKLKSNLFNSLNEPQFEILLNLYSQCLNAASNQFFALVEGPPGTGKSRIIIELANQLKFCSFTQRSIKILICSERNETVDLITRQLIRLRAKIVNREKRKQMSILRYGWANKMYPDVEMLTPQALLKREYYRNINKNEALKYEWIVKGATIICTTTSLLCDLYKYVQNFDVCILDDASECSELSSILPLQFNPTSVILFGDEKQESSDISSTGLNRSLFTRIIDGYKKFKKNCPNIHRLNEQFLMKNEICRALNTLFYDGRMETAKNVFDPEFKLNPYGFFDNSGVYFLIDLIKVVNEFLDSEQFSYRIIVPTHDDKKHLESILLLTSNLRMTIDTIDACLKLEKDVVIVWATANITKQNLILKNLKLQAAMSRAKKCLYFCGDFSVVNDFHSWERLLDNAVREGLMFSALGKENDCKKFIRASLKKT